jgi:hypothetical protein
VVRPIAYSSVSEMEEVIAEAGTLGLTRADYRVFTAHYSGFAHICGPATCKYPGLTQSADATQWTSSAAGLNGSKIDVSWLSDNFFDGVTFPHTPTPVPQVPPARRNIFTPVAEDGIFGYHTCAALQFVIFAGNVPSCDGYFGPVSKKQLQKYLNVQPDGVIGPITIKALQQRVGAKQDMAWGPVTTKDLQISLNKGLF